MTDLSPFSSWQYNVVDKYKGQDLESIKDDLQKTTLPCAVLMAQVVGDFNFGCVIRNSNNFNVREVFYYGKKKFDRRSALGTYHYTKVTYLSSFQDLKDLKAQYSFVGLENNIKGTVPLSKFIWPKQSLIVLGEEGVGISPDLIDLLDYTVEIPSIGSVRSINVASASSIALYDYYTKSLV